MTNQILLSILVILCDFKPFAAFCAKLVGCATPSGYTWYSSHSGVFTYFEPFLFQKVKPTVWGLCIIFFFFLAVLSLIT